ncbi:DUF2860 domain-containing protein [Vibrio alfacsensis]|uniref:DUF2860 domain-containing protein n=1 Tax=Vibrio alfacsensis TaxID=1074311 RepID=UPI004069504A
MKIRLSLLSLTMVSLPSLANLASEPGFSGEVSASVGFTQISSNLYTGGDKSISSPYQRAGDESNAFLFPLGNVAYTFSGLDKQVYFGVSRDDLAVGDLAVELGYRQVLTGGMVLDLSLVPTVVNKDVWADPYLPKVNRSKTEESGNAFRLKLTNINGTNFNLDTAFAVKDVENEQSAKGLGLSEQQRVLLARDNSSFYLKGSYQLRLDSTSLLRPSVTITKTNADGDAFSASALGAEMSYFKVFNQHRFALTAKYTNRDYDETNPIYGVKRENSEAGVFFAYEQVDFMDWNDWSLVALAGFNNNDSNIDFYDIQESLMSVGMNYRF